MARRGTGTAKAATGTPEGGDAIMREFDLDHNDDMFADTRMSFGEHIEELRTHLIRAILGFVIAMVFSFWPLGHWVLESIIIAPVEAQLQGVYDRRANEIIEKMRREQKEEKERLQETGSTESKLKFFKVAFLRKQLEKLKEGHVPDDDARPTGPKADDVVKMWIAFEDPQEMYLDLWGEVAKKLGPRPSMKTMNVTEAFMVYFKVSIYCGFVLASPWIFYQLWAFVAAGLYPHERRYVHVYLPLSLGLFLLGVVVCQFLVLPKAIEALLYFNEWLNVDPDLRLNEWLSFAIMFPLVMGLSFQTPLVMMFLERLGILEVEAYRRKRRIAYFVLLIVAAIGPSIDPFSLMIIWVSLCLLYELGIWLCLWSPRSGFRSDAPEPEEMVEV